MATIPSYTGEIVRMDITANSTTEPLNEGGGSFTGDNVITPDLTITRIRRQSNQILRLRRHSTDDTGSFADAIAVGGALRGLYVYWATAAGTQVFQYGPIDGTEPAFSFRLDLESGDTVDGPVAGALCYLVIGSNTLTPDPDPEPITPSTPTGLRVRTPDVWEIDWDDAGDYSHAAANVSGDVLDYHVSYGLNAASNDRELPNTSARGRLILDNAAGTYSSETSTTITRAELRKRHLIRAVRGARTLWEGTVQPARQIRSIDQEAELELIGKLTEPYRERHRLSQTGAVSTATMLSTLRTDEGITESALPTSIPAPSTGTVFFDSSVRSFLTNLAAYVGGYAMEDRLGALLFMPYTYAKITSPAVTIDQTLEIRASSLETYLRDGLVRNAIDMEAVGVTLGAEQDLASVPIVLGAGTGETIFRASNLDQTALAVQWVSPSSNAIPGATIRSIGGNADGYAFGVTPSSAIDTTLTIRGRPWRQTTGREESIEVADSVDDFDIQQLDVPPWYTQDTFAFGQQWIMDLARETRYTFLQLPRWQTTAANNDAVDALEAGMLVDLVITTPQNEPIAERALIAGAELSGGQGRVPVLGLHLISVEAASAAERLG